MTKNIWLVGSAAGFATVMLLVSSGMTAGGSFLSFFIPLPGLIAGLAYGWPVAGIAGLTGAVLFFIASSGIGGLVYIIIVAVPATMMAHVIGLWRPDDTTAFTDSFRRPAPVGREDDVDWYPLSNILMWLVFIAGGLAVFSTLALGTDDLAYTTTVHEIMDDFIDRRMAPVFHQELSLDQRASLKLIATTLLPAMVALTWMFLMIFNTWIAAKVVRASGMMARPAPDMRMVGLPRGIIFGLGIMLLATSAGGLVGRGAVGFAGAALFAILLVGLAVVHEWTVGKPARMFMLTALYVALLGVWQLAVPPLLVLGLAEPFFRFRDKFRARRQSRRNPPD